MCRITSDHNISITVPCVFYVWGKFVNFNEFYNGYERTEQLYGQGAGGITAPLSLVPLSLLPSPSLSINPSISPPP